MWSDFGKKYMDEVLDLRKRKKREKTVANLWMIDIIKIEVLTLVVRTISRTRERNALFLC